MSDDCTIDRGLLQPLKSDCPPPRCCTALHHLTSLLCQFPSVVQQDNEDPRPLPPARQFLCWGPRCSCWTMRLDLTPSHYKAVRLGTPPLSTASTSQNRLAPVPCWLTRHPPTLSSPFLKQHLYGSQNQRVLTLRCGWSPRGPIGGEEETSSGPITCPSPQWFFCLDPDKLDSTMIYICHCSQKFSATQTLVAPAGLSAMSVRWATNKHYDPKWRKHRRMKVLDVSWSRISAHRQNEKRMMCVDRCVKLLFVSSDLQNENKQTNPLPKKKPKRHNHITYVDNVPQIDWLSPVFSRKKIMRLSYLAQRLMRRS